MKNNWFSKSIEMHDHKLAIARLELQEAIADEELYEKLKNGNVKELNVLQKIHRLFWMFILKNE